MIRTETGLVRKYFEPMDSFLTLRSFSRTEAHDLLRGVDASSKRRYLRAIVEACVVDYRESVRPELARAFGEASVEDVEVALYQCCIEANPCLEIHSVLIPVEGPVRHPEPLPERQDLFADAASAADIEERLSRRVFGQPEAVSLVSRAVKRAAAGVRSPERPVGCFVFVGSTGVGKTELAKALGDELYGEAGLVRIDCSEFAMPHEYAKLIGAPPGYVGHSEGGVLTDAVRQNPESVVLFDEVEKADSKLHALLLQICDEGFLTDSRGRKCSFRKAVVIMTSNLGTRDAAELAHRAGFDQLRRTSITASARSETTMTAVRECFSPELLGRLDAVCVFDELDDHSRRRIVDAELSELSARLAERGRRIRFSSAARRHLVERGTSTESGARELSRVIARVLEDPIASMVVEGTYPEGAELRVNCPRGSVRFRVAA